MMKSSVRWTFILVGTAAYFAVAVVARGGLKAYFSHPPLVALAIALFALAGVALFAGGNVSPGVREDRGNRWVLVAFGVLGLLDCYLPAYLDCYLPAYTDRIEFWTIDGDAVRWLGVVLFVAGGTLRVWPVFVLGRRFSGLVAIQPAHTLVTGGVYSVIRHPSYLGLFVNSLGWGLAFRSGVGVLLTALTMLPLLARIRAEERLLHSQFGDEYDAYCARTSRLIPRLF
jgi:protein-S-isoprenylcysteine O-methyltransferase Ste14